MSGRAYVVAHMELDEIIGCWVMTGAGIYSESATTITGAFDDGRFSADIFSVYGTDYDEAADNAMSATMRHMPWLVDYFGRRQ